MKNHFILATALSSLITVILSKELKSLVVSAPEASTRRIRSIQDEDNDTILINPQIYSLKIHTDITHRYATTLITSKVRNLNQTAEQTTFAVILPETAFISSFSMEIDGKTYKAHVEEKQEAKNIYDEAVSKGQSAAHVSARDSSTFMVSVNVEPRSKASFELRYEELLRRELGHYEHVLNINPGQVVEDMDVEVSIRESRPLVFVRKPSLRIGNEVSKNEDLGPLADVRFTGLSSALVKFHPDRALQKNLALLLGTKKEYGLAGQFVVQYDVQRDPARGEVLIRDGYFVHFFAPTDLRPLPKHVVFVLDYSGSMSGQKLHQLVDAMKSILSELDENDLFSIVQFQSWTSVLDVTGNRFVSIKLDKPNYGHLETRLRNLNLPDAARATPENIEKARKLLEMNTELGSTNIIEGLEVGLFLVKRAREKDRRQAMMVFLTDGLPNQGMVSEDEIIETVTKLNNGETSIFSLSFGEDADRSFLEELSLKNFGFCRHIYEAADASLQLQNFYRKISSPLLSDVTFKYVGGVRDVTQNNYPLYFEGSELVVAGRIDDTENTFFDIYGVSGAGFVNFTSVEVEAVDSMERLWAYLTVRQLLQSKNNSIEVTKRALDLSLKYSFVTELTSLILVKPSPDEKEIGIALDPDFKPITSGGLNFFSSFILLQLFCSFNGILYIYFKLY